MSYRFCEGSISAERLVRLRKYFTNVSTLMRRCAECRVQDSLLQGQGL